MLLHLQGADCFPICGQSAEDYYNEAVLILKSSKLSVHHLEHFVKLNLSCL